MKELYLDNKLFTGTEEEFLDVKEFLYKEWYQNGKRHRIDGPAIIWPDGTEHWYKNGKYHRDDGPAVIRSDGYQVWYQNEKLHRINGPAVIYSNRKKEWYIEGFEFYEFFDQFFPIKIFKKKYRRYKK